MATAMMNLRDLVEKAPDADLLREMIGFAAERPMEPEVGAVAGAACGEKDPARLARRNGYRDRDWETRAGTVALRIPKLRKGRYFPGFLEPRRMAESEPANASGSGERANADGGVQGISTRSVDDLVKAMGMPGISKSQVSRLCEESDGQVKADRLDQEPRPAAHDRHVAHPGSQARATRLPARPGRPRAPAPSPETARSARPWPLPRRSGG